MQLTLDCHGWSVGPGPSYVVEPGLALSRIPVVSRFPGNHVRLVFNILNGAECLSSLGDNSR